MRPRRLEREAAKDREKQQAKEQREAQRKAEKAERDRVKDEEKRSKAKVREEASVKLKKKKEDAIKHKQKLAKYPVDDQELRVEFEQEATQKKLTCETLGYKQLPSPTLVKDGPFLANEAALADFLNVFGEALKTPKGVSTVKGIRTVISGAGEELRTLYLALLKPCMEVQVLGKGRTRCSGAGFYPTLRGLKSRVECWRGRKWEVRVALRWVRCRGKR